VWGAVEVCVRSEGTPHPELLYGGKGVQNQELVRQEVHDTVEEKGDRWTENPRREQLTLDGIDQRKGTKEL